MSQYFSLVFCLTSLFFPFSHSTLMNFLLISRKVAVRHIPHSTGCCFNSAAGPRRWSSTALNNVSHAQPWRGSRSRTPPGLLAVAVPLVFQTCTQRRYNSNKSTPPSVDLFSRHGAAKRRRQEELVDRKDGDERASHVEKQKDPSQDHGSDRKRKDDEEAKEDPRKEAVEEKQGLKTYRPARLPIVLCHGNESHSTLFLVLVCQRIMMTA